MRLPREPEPGGSPSVAVRDDARLLTAIAAGDQQALAAFYRHRGSFLYSLLVRMLVNEAEAQDIMQDTFVQVWRRASEYDPNRSSALTWVMMIARGLAVDRLRARV